MLPNFTIFNMFLPEFHIIVCGLDSIIARRWINGMLVNTLKQSSLVYAKCGIRHCCSTLLMTEVQSSLDHQSILLQKSFHAGLVRLGNEVT